MQGTALMLMLTLVAVGASPAKAQDSVFLEELTWTEVRDKIHAGTTTVIIPTGGTEQNGPHMILGKHNYRVKFTAGEVAMRLGSALVAPVIAYVPEGNIEPPSGHMWAPGTISLSPELFAKVVEHAACGFAAHGFTDIVLIGDSGDNQAPLQAVAKLLTQEWATKPVRVFYVAAYYDSLTRDFAEWLQSHGVGHAIMVLSGYDLREALQSCTAFESAPLQYYCASGVFMEYESQPPPPQSDTRSPHYPCDTYTEFPSACYKYRTQAFLQKARGNPVVVAQECLRLESTQRHGCFYGLGAVHLSLLAKQPERLGIICKFGDRQDQGMCINGAIEVLADYQPKATQKACVTLTGEKATFCSAAARNKRYGLEKDFSLHYR